MPTDPGKIPQHEQTIAVTRLLTPGDIVDLDQGAIEYANSMLPPLAQGGNILPALLEGSIERRPEEAKALALYYQKLISQAIGLTSTEPNTNTAEIIDNTTTRLSAKALSDPDFIETLVQNMHAAELELSSQPSSRRSLLSAIHERRRAKDRSKRKAEVQALHDRNFESTTSRINVNELKADDEVTFRLGDKNAELELTGRVVGFKKVEVDRNKKHKTLVLAFEVEKEERDLKEAREFLVPPRESKRVIYIMGSEGNGFIPDGTIQSGSSLSIVGSDGFRQTYGSYVDIKKPGQQNLSFGRPNVLQLSVNGTEMLPQR